MLKNLLFICFTLISFVGISQQNNDLSKVESLMLDSRYEEVIKFIDSTPANSKNSIILSIKKAEALIKLGKTSDADVLLKKVESSLAQEKNPVFYKALIAMNYGALYQNQGRNDLAIDQFQLALDNLEQDKRSANLEAAEALAYLGNVYRSTGKYVQAEEQLQRALTIRQAKLPETH
jgi:tetratricopeptide (TPR) repeat protein